MDKTAKKLLSDDVQKIFITNKRTVLRAYTNFNLQQHESLSSATVTSACIDVLIFIDQRLIAVILH